MGRHPYLQRRAITHPSYHRSTTTDSGPREPRPSLERSRTRRLADAMSNPDIPLKVRFSPDIFRVETFGGVSRYIVELHRAYMTAGIDSRIIAGLHRNMLAAQVPRVWGLNVEALRPTLLRQALTRITSRVTGEIAARYARAPTIWHCSYYSPTVPPRAPMVVTVYDMIHELFPSSVTARDTTLRYKRAACHRADLLIAISNTTADDIAERYGLDRGQIEVIPLGISLPDPAEVTPPFKFPFVLYVGNRDSPYKNWELLLNAVASIKDLGLVCIGAPPRARELALAERLRIDRRIAFRQTTDQQLVGWFQAALGYISTSSYEGFGLPAAEALSVGCPVVATHVGAVPEVLGDLPIYVDPTHESVMDGLHRLLSGGRPVDRQRSEGPKAMESYRWATTAQRTREAYDRLID